MRAILICACACLCLAIVGCGDDDDAAAPDAGIDGGDTDSDTDSDSDSDTDSDVDTSTEAVVHYRFDSCDGTTPNAMGTGLDATLDGDAYCAAEDALSDALGAAWSSGTSLVCDGDGDFAEVPDEPALNPPSFTVSAWIYSEDFGECPSDCTVASKGSTDSPALGWWLYVRSSGFWALSISGDGLETVVLGPTLDSGTWHHLAATFDGVTATIYRNGAQIASKAVDHGLTYGTEPLSIGALPNRHYDFYGNIEEVILWNYAKSADEVAELYESYTAAPDGGVDGGTDAG